MVIESGRGLLNPTRLKGKEIHPEFLQSPGRQAGAPMFQTGDFPTMVVHRGKSGGGRKEKRRHCQFAFMQERGDRQNVSSLRWDQRVILVWGKPAPAGEVQ